MHSYSADEFAFGKVWFEPQCDREPTSKWMEKNEGAAF